MILDTTHAIGWKANDFAIQGIDGKTYSLAEVRGPKGTLVVFICNHCPYVKGSISRIVAEAKALRQIGIGTIAIMAKRHRELSRELLRQHQGVRSAAWFHLCLRSIRPRKWRAPMARNARPISSVSMHKNELRYQGRLDALRMTPIADARRDLKR